MNWRRKKSLRRTAVAAGGLAVGLVLAEVALRLLLGPMTGGLAPVFALPLDGVFHRAGAAPGVGWELVPGAHGRFQGVAVTINALGQRGGEIAVAKPAGTRRVVVLGDSIVFGAGVADDATFCTRLNERLGPEVTVINAGVSGYNATQMGARFFHRDAALQPDLLVVGFFDDDLNEPYRVGAPSLTARLTAGSVLWQGLHRGWWQWRLRRFAAGAPWRDARQWAAIERAYQTYERLLTWTREHDAAALFLLFPDFRVDRDSAQTTLVKKWLAQWRVPSVDVGAGYRAASDDPARDFSIRAATFDPHPNEAGHELIAAAIAARIDAEQLLR